MSYTYKNLFKPESAPNGGPYDYDDPKRGQGLIPSERLEAVVKRLDDMADSPAQVTRADLVSLAEETYWTMLHLPAND